MRCQNSHMMKQAVFDAFHIIGSGLWMLRGITLKVYEYIPLWYFINYLYLS
jgi:hypothetical protein